MATVLAILIRGKILPMIETLKWCTIWSTKSKIIWDNLIREKAISKSYRSLGHPVVRKTRVRCNRFQHMAMKLRKSIIAGHTHHLPDPSISFPSPSESILCYKIEKNGSTGCKRIHPITRYLLVISFTVHHWLVILLKVIDIIINTTSFFRWAVNERMQTCCDVHYCDVHCVHSFICIFKRYFYATNRER